MVGRILNAKFISGPSTTPVPYDLNRKSLPASEKLNSFKKILSTAEKNG